MAVRGRGGSGRVRTATFHRLRATVRLPGRRASPPARSPRTSTRDGFRDLSRLAYLLTGDHDAADDLAAEAFAEAWKRWDRVTGSDSPLAYVRRIVVNMAASRVRGLVRERRGRRLLGALWSERAPERDDAAITDVRDALARLPMRKRACVILRHYYGLSEKETAATLGIAVGTVKSQTSRGVAEVAALLGVEPGRGSNRPGTTGGAR